ncbi:DUF1506 family protein [Borreliella burgdorferi]|uniref:DUF1506 family protein n=1 Tax=Borreliella burgdorferi TaxID=139 RepID=UPI0034678FBB
MNGVRKRLSDMSFRMINGSSSPATCACKLSCSLIFTYLILLTLLYVNLQNSFSSSK